MSYKLFFFVPLFCISCIYAEQIHPIFVTANSHFVWEGKPLEINTMIDPKRITENDQFIMQNGFADSFLSGMENAPSAHWIAFDLGNKYDLSDIKIWNYCDVPNNGKEYYDQVLGRGVKEASIWVAEADVLLTSNYRVIGWTWSFNYNPSLDGEDKFYSQYGWKKIWSGSIPQGIFAEKGTPIDPQLNLQVENKNIRYIGIAVTSKWGSDPWGGQALGVSYLLAKGTPSKGVSLATPVDGYKNLYSGASLTWNPLAGDQAVLKYRVFLDTENASVDVTDTDADGDDSNCSFTPSEPFQGWTNYYWRVEAIREDQSVVSSSVRTFTASPESPSPVITPISAWANSSFDPESETNLFDIARLDNQRGLLARPGIKHLYLSKSLPDDNKTDQQWICFDLGAPYRLDLLRVWNYLEKYDQIADSGNRSVKNITIYLGRETAVLPQENSEVTGMNPDGHLDAFVNRAGWEKVFSGDIPRNPFSYSLVDGEPFPENKVIPLQKKLARFVAIDINTTYFDRAHMTQHTDVINYAGMGHFQIHGEKLSKGSVILLK